MATLHAWIVQGNSIVDPTTILHEAEIKELRGVAPGAPRVYEEREGQEKILAWKHVWKTIVKPRLDSSEAPDEDLAALRRTPAPNACFMNCYAILVERKPGVRMALGKMGWSKPDREVFWEFD